ncbi:glycosyltransferase family 32 protein [Methylobacterium brachiatum]|uniref:glycosyltransferase family 32 protein n=1 Tax=Methylobacterium brachiatum TaxID=269660 RepID=UPI0013CE4976|nr:glycosyltransferase [Methylobacterium brachiatum]
MRKIFSLKNASTSNAIPRKIHQLWISPAHLKAIPDDVIPQTMAWTEFHPGFKHKIWTIEEAEASLPKARAKQMMEAVRLSRFEAMKADIVRLYLLSEFGGFWSDLKVKPRRRWLDDYLDKGLVLVEHFPFGGIPNPSGTLMNGFFGCAPNNTFVEACIDQIHKNIDMRLSTTIWEVTGPRVFMNVYSNWGGVSEKKLGGVVIPWSCAWNSFMEMGHGSYSSNHRHWSVREKEESIYLD